jgi:transposase
MAKNKKQKCESETSYDLQPNSAGIDIGATEIFVAVPEGRSSKTVRKFDTFTENLHEAAKWLKECGIESIAMESTGVYWIPIFQILDAYGFDVILVYVRHVKNVSDRKTEIQDCQWLQFLHSVGLLRGSFRPAQDVCAVRSLLRHRDNMVKAASSHVQHMQKSLTGDYRPEHVFTLNQALQSYRNFQQMIKECDAEIEKHLKEFDSRIDLDQNPLLPSKKIRRKSKQNAPDFNLRGYMYRIMGVDLTRSTESVI